MENQMSLIEIALKIMESSKEPLNIYTLIEKTLAEKGINDPDGIYAAKLYTDITISSKFVYMGDDLWDLKSRQPLEQFDKDGSSFISKDEEYSDPTDYEDDEDEEEDLEEDDEIEDRYDNEDSDEEDEEDSYEDEEEDLEEEDDEDNYDESDETEEDSYDDEDKYNQIMDDYEDLYED